MTQSLCEKVSLRAAGDQIHRQRCSKGCRGLYIPYILKDITVQPTLPRFKLHMFQMLRLIRTLKGGVLAAKGASGVDSHQCIRLLLNIDNDNNEDDSCAIRGAQGTRE